MAKTLVLYAEGAAETISSRGLTLSPTSPLTSEAWGAAHWLVSRCAELVSDAPVAFLPPQRVMSRHVRGSDLLDSDTLRDLCTWFHPDRIPDAAVVLIDEDEDSTRRGRLRTEVSAFESPPCVHPIVIGVAKQEFEAWLIADATAVQEALGLGFKQPQSPESMRRGVAKDTLNTALSASPQAHDPLGARVEIARRARLEVVRKTCASFETFLQELRQGLN